MAGIVNDVLYALNCDYTGGNSAGAAEANGLITNGQIWIGRTAVNAGGTHIDVGTITGGSGITVTNGAGTITISATGSTASSSYNFQVATGTSQSPIASTTYYLAQITTAVAGSQGGWRTTLAGESRLYIPKTGTITSIIGSFSLGSPGTSENTTLQLRLNNTTNTILSSTLNFSTTVPLSFTGLSIAVTAGDYISLQLVTPAWVTAPLSVTFSCTIFGS